MILRNLNIIICVGAMVLAFCLGRLVKFIKNTMLREAYDQLKIVIRMGITLSILMLISIPFEEKRLLKWVDAASALGLVTMIMGSISLRKKTKKLMDEFNR